MDLPGRLKKAETLRFSAAGVDSDPVRPSYLDGSCPNCGIKLLPDPDPRMRGALTCPSCRFTTNVREAS